MARRRNGRRRHRRRGRFGFFYKLVTTLLICAAIIVALTMFFRAEAIVVSGNVRYTAEQIQEASGISRGDNLFLLNRRGAAQRVTDALPYIENVHLSPKLPDTLMIEVTECAAAFAIPQEGTVWIMSASGKLVGTEAGAGDLPVIEGCPLLAPSVGASIAFGTELQEREDSLLALTAALDRAGVLEQVQAIRLDSAAELVMDYANRFAVKMRYGADYDKMLRFIDMVLAQLESNETGTIDLTTEGEALVQRD